MGLDPEPKPRVEHLNKRVTQAPQGQLNFQTQLNDSPFTNLHELFFI